jgi:hypothetical protein
MNGTPVGPKPHNVADASLGQKPTATDASELPDGLEPDHHDPDSFSVRCTNCGYLDTKESRARAHRKADNHGLNCAPTGVTPVSELRVATDGGIDKCSSVTERILDVVSEEIGVRIYDSWLDQEDCLFRGPHGLLESIGWNDRHECWTRSPYCRQPVLRGYVEKATSGHSQYTAWNYVTREEIGEPEPVVSEVSDWVRCSLCGDEFDGGNPLAWHLADDHELAEDVHQMEYAAKIPSGQQSLARYATDCGRSVDTGTDRQEDDL